MEKEYSGIGVIRRSSSVNTSRIDHLISNDGMTLVEGDITDLSSIYSILEVHRPDEVYNLAAQSPVGTSFNQPLFTWDVTAKGCLNLLEAIIRVDGGIKFYQASSSEMFGKVVETPKSEKTPLYPRSPYGCAKAFAYWITKNYRESYELFACNGILFNHESPRRGETFVTRKITSL